MQNKLLTIVMVSFHSETMLKKLIPLIPKEYKIIVTDNARTKSLKDDLEKKFTNTKVLIPKKNLGNGDGVNFALRNTKTKYVLYLDVDTIFKKNFFKDMILNANLNQNWAILAPNIKNYNYHKKNFILKKRSKNIFEMNFVEGCALLFNMNTMKKIGFYDKKIFLYFEENDLFVRCLKKNKSILLVKDIFISHIGNASANKKYQEEIEINRNWHYMWSKFYFYKKHHSSFVGFKKTIPHFLKAMIKCVILFLFNKKKFNIYKARFFGLWSSYLNKPSAMRPRI